MTTGKLLYAFVMLWTVPTIATAQERAAEAIAEGVPEHLVYALQPSADDSATAAQQLNAAQLWPKDEVLRVCFFGGNAVVKKLIATIATQWNQYSIVKFDFGKDNEWRDCVQPRYGFSQVRVGFSGKGYWALVGPKEQDLTFSTQPTVNLEGFERYNPLRFNLAGQKYTPINVVDLATPYDKGTILHEFGHVLGLMHEQLNPTLKCYDALRWKDHETVYEYYFRTEGWNPAMTDYNVGTTGLGQPSVPGLPDPDSIMMYYLPITLKIDGASTNCFNRHNNSISALDKQIVSRLYSKPEPSINFVSVPANATFAAASPKAQTDLLERVTIDLQSNTTSVRREARRQLAGLLQTARSPALAEKVAQAAVGGTYRTQLGFAEALINTSLPFGSDQPARFGTIKAINTMIAVNKDATLGVALEKAKDNVDLY